MSDKLDLFITRIYHSPINKYGIKINSSELEATCYSVANDDGAGQDWCEKNNYSGYTSYASLDDLPWRFPIFKDLAKALDLHVADFADELQFDLDDRPLVLNGLWINVLPEGGVHTGHIHPNSVISGTAYVSMPTGASAIKFEDPRLPMMMAAPPKKNDANIGSQIFSYIKPNVGDVLLWESWLRHEVPMNLAEEDRISISFNYAWA
ncbi:MAG: TIGR02466 family protein [Amylibacter sp.]|nr:TIGR02466 family protein [Amylibacter sp.]